MKNKNKVLFKMLSFLLPIIILILCNIVKGNGFSNVMKLPDVDLQYIPLLKYLKSVLLFDNSIMYSFSKSLGGSMFATYFYYLSSPINIICILFKNISYETINVLMFLKIGLCGMMTYIFLGSKADKYLINFVFSLCYALMGYNIIYAHNVMWFDVVYITPIVFLGIDLLIKNDDWRLYTFSLIYAIMCNFYIAFSLCIFSFIYTLYNLLIVLDKNRIKILKKFLFLSLFIGGICALFLIPISYELINLNDRFVMTNLISYDLNNLPLVLYKGLVGSNSLAFYSIMNVDAPNIYCSILVVLLNLFYLFCYDVSKKEKIVIIVIELFFILSMVFQPLYLMWHCFSTTNGNPYRFSFLWCFFHIFIAYKSMMKIYDNSNFNYKKIFLVSMIFFLLIIFSFFSKAYSYFYNGTEIIISAIFCFLYVILIKKKLINYVLLLLIFELILNCYITLDYKMLYADYSDKRSALCDTFEDLNSLNKRINAFGLNNSLYCGYSSFSGYFTTFSNDLFEFANNFGILYKQNLILDDSFNSEIIESILGIDYYIDDYYNIFENKNALSVGYLIEYDKVINNGSILLNHQSILNSMIGKNYSFFRTYSLSKENNQRYYYTGNGKEKYLIINSDNANSYILKLSINGISRDNNELGYLVFPYKLVRIRDSSDIVFIDLSIYCPDDRDCNAPSLELYEIDDDMLNKAINILKEQQLNVTKMEKNTLEGNIDVTKDNQYLFLSIPYEKGWNIYVDGKKVNYEKLYDAFIGIKLDKGHHNIKMIFYPYGLKQGICISIGSLIILVVYLRFNKRRRN